MSFSIKIYDAYLEDISPKNMVKLVVVDGEAVVDTLYDLLTSFEGFSIVIEDKSKDREIYSGTLDTNVLDYMEDYLDK